MADIDRELVTTFYTTEDRMIHISRLNVRESVYLDIREFVPSLQEYGRGLTVPAHLASELLDGLVLFNG